MSITNPVLYYIILALHLISTIGLMAGVVLQSGRSAGLSGAIAGGATTLFGKKKGLDEKLARITTVFAVVFLVCALLLTIVHR